MSSPRPQGIFGLLHFQWRIFLDGFQDLVNSAVELGVAAFGHQGWIVHDGDIGIHAVAFDDPFAFGAEDTERGDSDAAAINERRSAADADQSTPGARAYQRAEAGFLEVE